MEDLKTALAKYIAVLADSLNRTSRAEDRSKHRNHLAEAAIMFSLIQYGREVSELKEKVGQERRSYGCDYLSGPEGEAAEKSFNEFAVIVENLPDRA